MTMISGGKQDRAIDLADRQCDGGELSGESARRLKAGERVGGTRPRRFGQASENVLDENDGCDHDKSKIDGADRQQVRGFAHEGQNDDREGERERDGRRDDDGAAQVAQKQPLHGEDEATPSDQIPHHFLGRQADQAGAVVNALEAHAGRQNPRAIDLVHLRFDAMDGRRRLLAAAHEDDALNDVVVVVLPGDSEPRLIARFDGRHILDHDRTAVIGRQHGLLDVVDGLNQAYAANDRCVRSEIEALPADIQIVVAERLDDR